MLVIISINQPNDKNVKFVRHSQLCSESHYQNHTLLERKSNFLEAVSKVRRSCVFVICEIN